jgi:hypothetical protein
MTTPTTITYDAVQARADDLRQPERMPRSTRVRPPRATRRAELARHRLAVTSAPGGGGRG